MPVPPSKVRQKVTVRPAASPVVRPTAAPILPTQRQELKEFRPAPDPLAKVPYTGNVEQDAAAEMSALDAGFRQRMQNEQARVNDELDSENWVAIVFETRDQKEAFLAAVGLLQHGDKYLDCRDVAKVLGVELLPSGRTYRPEPRIDSKLAALAKPVAYRK